MTLNSNELRREQLDRAFGSLSLIQIPKDGWIKAIRSSLGMSMRDLADRMHLAASRISRIEQDEVEGRVTLDTMKKVAEGLNCEFVYFLVPKKGSLQSTVDEQAKAVALENIKSLSKSMGLEDQGTSIAANQKMLEKAAQEIKSSKRKLWK